MRDLAALTPPLLVCAAFLIAVVALLRHEMNAGRRRSAGDPRDDISADDRIAHMRDPERRSQRTKGPPAGDD
jgi:hypothetical protein